MDHMLPEMDGLQTTRLIRSLDSIYAMRVPIIALTANALAGNREVFLQNGVDDFIAKPIDVNKLDSVLKLWIPQEKQISWAAPYSNDDAAEGENRNAFFIEIPEIDGVDTKSGIGNTGGSPLEYMHILQTFCVDAKERIPGITDALKNGNIPLYTTFVHAMRSASHTIGAASLGELAEELENAGKNGNTEIMRQKTGAFIEQLSDLTERISSSLKDILKNTENLIGISDIELDTLKEALVKYDTDAVNLLLNKFRKMPLNSEARKLINSIEQTVLLFEYEKALALIENTSRTTG
jgi:CheY-like chemotaxis protein